MDYSQSERNKAAERLSWNQVRPGSSREDNWTRPVAHLDHQWWLGTHRRDSKGRRDWGPTENTLKYLIGLIPVRREFPIQKRARLSPNCQEHAFQKKILRTDSVANLEWDQRRIYFLERNHYARILPQLVHWQAFQGRRWRTRRFDCAAH